MAAISTLQASSIDITLNQLDWTDNGETNTLKRAPHGGSYSTLATVTGLTTYQDATAVTGTWYDYKIASGISGDSNVSSVVTQVCSSADPSGASLVGQYSQDQVTPQDFNNLIDDLNKTLQQENNQLLPCEVCPSNGAVILDCSTCSNFVVLVDQDINSISMLGCNNVGDGSISWEIPGGASQKICGFPVALGFDGAECNKNPGSLSGGTNGATYRMSFGGRSIARGTRQLQSKGKTGGAAKGLALTLTCKTSTGGTNSNCSMDCSGVKAMQVVATGGTPPYTFSVTGGLGKTVAGSTATLTPPTNSGSGVGGNAYSLCRNSQAALSNCNCQHDTNTFGCNDVQIGGTSSGNGSCICGGVGIGTVVCGDCTGKAICGGCDAPVTCVPNTNLGSCVGVAINQSMCDLRTGSMITNGCNPCGISVSSKVVTVTDATGAQVSKTILA